MGIKKTAILLLSMTVLMTSVFLTEQAFAGIIIIGDVACEDCERVGQDAFDNCKALGGTDTDCEAFQALTILNCIDQFCRSAVGGDMIQMETTSILVAGAQYTAAWMIPVIVSGIGIAIVIARKF